MIKSKGVPVFLDTVYIHNIQPSLLLITGSLCVFIFLTN